jgi:hypothetical protein
VPPKLCQAVEFSLGPARVLGHTASSLPMTKSPKRPAFVLDTATRLVDPPRLGRVGNVVRRQPSGLLRSAQTIDRLLRFREARARLLAVQLDGFDDTSLLYELEQVRVRCERRGLSALR